MRLLVVFLLLATLSHEINSQQKTKRSKRNHSTCQQKSMVRYKMTVYTLWSNITFPKMYPVFRPRAQWSTLVGRSHGTGYEMWAEGKNASSGVRLFAEQGDPDLLEMEATQGYGQVFDAFTGPPVQEGEGWTSSVVFVDGDHSKVSFMMKIIPSPDWFVGLSNLDLCENGRWKDFVKVNLHPMDSGTDRGLTFTSPNWPSDPREPITQITASSPDHPASSFFYPEYSVLPDIGYVELEKATEYRLRKSFAELPQNVSASSRTTPRPTTTTTTPTTIANSGEMQSAHVKLQPFSPKELDRNTLKISFSGSESLTSGVSGPVLWQQPGPDKISDTIVPEPSLASPISSDTAEPPQSQANNFVEPTESHNTLTSTTVGTTDTHTTQTSIDIQPMETLKLQTIPPIEIEVQPIAQTTTFVEPTEQPKAQTTSFVELTEQPKAQTDHFVEITEQPQSQPTRFVDRTEPHTSQLNIHKQSRKSARELPATRGQNRVFKNKVQHPFFDADNRPIDCEVDEWSAWSRCSVTCGFGQRTRSRTALRFPRNGGAYCPPLEEPDLCKPANCEWSPFSFFNSRPRVKK